MSSSDDELDAELRRLFDDERLGVLPRAGAGDAIVAGAQRLRRRRAMLTTAGGVATAVVLVAGGVVFHQLRGGEPALQQAADASSTTASAPSIAAPPPSIVGTSLPPSAANSGSIPPMNPAPGSSGTSQPSPPTSSQRANGVPPVLTGPQLGPDGYGKLKLAMTADEVTAQGITLRGDSSGGECQSYSFSGGPVPSTGQVVVSASLGVVSIIPSVAAHTPERIGKGSSKADVFQVYPGASEASGAGLTAPAGSIGSYYFGLDAGQKVSSVALRQVNQDCVG
ncbi:hypothetical protein [Amycolatopsis anabasis]|uniref:hypothetical protein n=1 Tax=Amycolatopsis anabasis TaxID=1840409 RepID=UPI00131EB63D|nr:hypothetical protein [Amycolatopsis anabasis]